MSDLSFFVATLLVKPLAPFVKFHDEKIAPLVWKWQDKRRKRGGSDE